MSLSPEKSFRMKMRDVEAAFKYRRFPYPKRSVELIALLAISCTFFLFMHTNKLNSRLKEMEMKLQPSEFSALGLTGSNHLDSSKHEDINTLHGTYQYLKSTGQLKRLNAFALNNTRKADIDVIFLNHCAIFGAEKLLELFRFLVQFNAGLTLKHDDCLGFRNRQLEQYEQFEYADNISDLNEGSIWLQHTNWIDFENYDLPKPIYINMVRDPVDTVVSWYFFSRSAYKSVLDYTNYPQMALKPREWYKKDFNHCVRSGDPECQYVPLSVEDYVGKFDRQSIYFCGHQAECLPFNSPAAVQMAKEHVERDYAVVGTWEETNITLTVFEKYIPRFFKGAKLLFEMNIDKITNRNKNKRKPKIDADVKEMIRKNFTHEYEFYHFCRQRLYKQYLAVSLKKLPGHN